MELSLFDLHCDTPYRMLTEGGTLEQNSFAVSLERARSYRRYVQIMAHWTPPALSDEEGWEQLLAMRQNLLADPAVLAGNVDVSTCVTASLPDKPLLLLAVEDARVLSGELSRVDRLWELGFRILTPLWAGISSLGGAHDTEEGLTPFGRTAVRRAVELGMLPDLSHASEQSAEEILSIAAELHRPVLASHSNVYEIRRITRNLRPWQIRAILDCAGIIGINLHVPFLTERDDATAEDILRHVDAFLSAGASEALAIGGDMDGAQLPSGFSSVDTLGDLAEEMLRRNYPESLIKNLFFGNAYRFAATYLSHRK